MGRGRGRLTCSHDKSRMTTMPQDKHHQLVLWSSVYRLYSNSLGSRDYPNDQRYPQSIQCNSSTRQQLLIEHKDHAAILDLKSFIHNDIRTDHLDFLLGDLLRDDSTSCSCPGVAPHIPLLTSNRPPRHNGLTSPVKSHTKEPVSRPSISTPFHTTTQPKCQTKPTPSAPRESTMASPSTRPPLEASQP